MTKIEELAASIARDIMKLGDQADSPAQRMQYMGGTYPNHETRQGGLNESALAETIECSLLNNFN